MVLGMTSSGVVVLFMLVLAVLLTRHYLRAGHAHTLWWAVSFWLALTAAGMDFTSFAVHAWAVWQYKLYLFAAAALVAYMGAGTVYLFSRRIGRVYVIAMTLVALAMAVTLVLTPIPDIVRLPPGEKAQGFVPQAVALYFALLSGIGAVAVFGGAVYSFFRTRRAYNLWIALGVLIFSVGGTVGDAVGIYQLFYAFQAAGSVVLYSGIVGSMRREEPAGRPHGSA